MKPITNSTKPRRVWADRVLIAAFLFLLWAPTLDSFFKLDRSGPPGENRLPAAFPQLRQTNLAGARQFIGGLENYFDDHFGFRKQLIRWFQKWKTSLFRDSSVYKIISGRDGWLFWGEAQMVEHFLGIEKFSTAQLQSWQTLLEARRDWLAARGIKYLFVIAPDKQSIYPEMLPDWLMRAVTTNRETKLDQFLKYMKNHSTVAILDLRTPLLAAKKIAPTYLQNDTHWNFFGSFVGAQAVVVALARDFPSLPTLDQNDFTLTRTQSTGGDMAKMLGLEKTENNFFTFAPKPGLLPLEMQEETKFSTPWGMRRVFNFENHVPRSVTIVLFTDSFGESWRKILGYPFQRTVFLDDNRCFSPPLIIATKPQIVVNEMVERSLNIEDPSQMLAKDPLP